MFKNFKEIRSESNALCRILSSQHGIAFYRRRFHLLKDYHSGVIFPEQLIGFQGEIFVVHLGGRNWCDCAKNQEARASISDSLLKTRSDESISASVNTFIFKGIKIDEYGCQQALKNFSGVAHEIKSDSHLIELENRYSPSLYKTTNFFTTPSDFLKEFNSFAFTGKKTAVKFAQDILAKYS